MSAQIPKLAQLHPADCLAPWASLPTQQRLKLCLHAKQALLMRLMNKIAETGMIPKDIRQRQILSSLDDLRVENMTRIIRN